MNVRGDEGEIENQEQPGQGDHERNGPVPYAVRDNRYQKRGNQHIAGHGDAISIGQRVRASKSQDKSDDRYGEEPIVLGHIDLSRALIGGLPHVQPRQHAKLDGLLHHGEGTRNDGLTRDDGGCRRQYDRRDQ